MLIRIGVRVVVMSSPCSTSKASPSRARRHKSGNTRVSCRSPARWRRTKIALAASSDRSTPLAKRSSMPSSSGATSSQWSSAHSAASCGRSFSALPTAWIAVSRSMERLRPFSQGAARPGWLIDACSSDRDAWCGWQRWLCRSTCHGGPRSLPVPGEQLVEPVDRRAPGDHPLEHIRQIGLRVEVVQLGRVDQTCQDRPGPGFALAPGEERILTAKCNRPHGPFNRVRVHLDPAVLQEHGETGPVAEHILDRLNQARSARKLDQGGHQPRVQSLQDWLRLGLPDGAPLGGAMPPDPRLNRINLAQGGDDVARERGMGSLVDGDELAPGMGQTECELDVGMTAGQPLVAPVAVYLENADEAVDL